MEDRATTGENRPEPAEARGTPLPIFPGPGEALYFDEEVQALRHFLMFFAGVSAGLVLALYLVLRGRD